MALYVQKFGGSSLSSIERIQHVAEIVKKTRDQGDDVVVVVSAMQGETDRLIELSRAISQNPDKREFDALVSTGERNAAALLSMALQKLSCKAHSYDAAQIGIHTDDCHAKARITDINTEVIKDDVHAGIVPVITGFQGVNEQGAVTTLGRGGSDISAVAIAAALQADECQIFTDVDGVYTSDPRIVKKAKCLQKITFNEMLALASVGAKVLQTRSVIFAHKYKMPLRVCSSFVEGVGTLITDDDVKERPIISGVGFDRHQAKLTVIGLPKLDNNYVQTISDAVQKAAIDLDMLVENESDKNIDLSFTVPMDDYSQAMTITKDIVKGAGIKDVIGNEDVAKLSLIGLGMKSHAGVATRMFNVLGEKGIPIHLISSSEVKISAVVDEQHIETGACLLHSAFDLDG